MKITSDLTNLTTAILILTVQMFFEWTLYAVHDCFKHAGGHDIFLLDWHQVLSYDVSLLNIRVVVNSLIDSV
jgi:hypothetical protein